MSIPKTWFLEKDIRPKTIIIEAKNTKQGTWYEFMRSHKEDGWGIMDIIDYATYCSILCYRNNVTARKNRFNGADIRIKTVLGDQLYNTAATYAYCFSLSDKRYSFRKPKSGELDIIVFGKDGYKDQVRKLSTEHQGLKAFNYVRDDIIWGKMKFNDGTVYHVARIDDIEDKETV